MSEFDGQIAEFGRVWTRVQDEVGKAIVGQEAVRRRVLTALLAGGHVLLEGVPGVGKTALVRAFAAALDLKFSRIQFTPDLMPADIVGTQIVVERPEGGREFRFQPGPVFAQVILADEINRATPKTQSALLEAMQEGRVTAGGATRDLEPPFIVIATQNPLEMEGTYPLPEAQLDRFLFKVEVPFPGLEELDSIVERTTRAAGEDVSLVANAAEILALRAAVRAVVAAPEVRRYALGLVRATHPETEEAGPLAQRCVRYGASPRGAQALLLGGKVAALGAGRAHVTFDDIAEVAHPALDHRVLLNYEGQADGVAPRAVVREALERTPRRV